jgi:hypothetical protein
VAFAIVSFCFISSLIGFCCNEYSVCDDPDAFTLDTKEADPMAFTEENCEGDFIRIEGKVSECP